MVLDSCWLKTHGFSQFFPVQTIQELQRLRDGRAAFTKENVSAAVEQDGHLLGKPWATHGYAATPKLMVVDDQLTMLWKIVELLVNWLTMIFV